jgi:catechol 2,3-dioxygenase-like lactoylglutathione lyase family enzyme
MDQAIDRQIEFEDISPVFFVTDVSASLAFYRERLGFDIGWIWGDPPTHANVCRGRISISLTLDPAAAGGAEAYVGLKGVDAYFAELQNRNVAVGELADRPYGMRDFAVIDPSQNRLVFGEPITE